MRMMALCGVTSFAMGLIGVMAGLTLFALPPAQAQAGQLRASRLTIADPDDRDRIWLDATPALALLSADGIARVLQQTGPDARAEVLLQGPDGSPRVQLATGGRAGTNPEAAGLSILREGTTIARIGTDVRAPGVVDAVVVLADRAGRPRIELLVDDDGTPSVRLLDGEGNVTWRAE
jgi:hypothetical protein